MKLKRLLTGVLSAVMALSVCAMPALADDSVGLTTSTINQSKLGSITIYKYAQTEDQQKTDAPKSTGEVTSETIPGSALANATFTLYRVKGTADLVKYYDGVSDGTVAEVKVENFFVANASAQTADNLKSEYKGSAAKDSDTELGKIVDETTNKDGKASFTDLPVGLYLLIETTVPESVTKPTTPFLVSVPMTRVATEEGKDKQWLYDVTVYPKNSTVQGTVTLEKKGSNGKTTETLEGVKFDLWRFEESDNAYKKITPATGITTGTNGTVELKNLIKGRYVLQETGYTDGNDKGYILNTKGIYAFSINNQGKVDENSDTDFTSITANGEKVEKGDSFTWDNTSGTTITITNYKPDLEKNVTKRGETEVSENHDADYGTNEDIPYTLTIKVPENVAKLKTFKVTDTTKASQLVQNVSSVKVTGIAKSAGATETELTKKTEYTVSVGPDGNGNSVMVVDFDPQTLKKIGAYAGGTITITYTAKLQDGAVIAGKGNVNTADLSYSRTTDVDKEDGDTNKPYQIENKGVVYTFEVNIKKTGGTTNGKALDGVTFDLYKKATKDEVATYNKQTQQYTFRETPCTGVTGTAAKNLGLTAEGNSNEVWLKVATLTTVGDGTAKESGLPAGEYKLVETKTVDGYNLLSEPVDAKLEIEYETQWETKIQYDGNGKEIKRNHAATTYKRDGTETTTPSETLNIVNRKGFTLPVTGGFGTLLFSGIGVLLVLAGVCVLFSMKKKNNRA